jgi:hypothetical protein
MKDLVKNLIGMGITIGLSDRSTFVKEVTSLIERYQSDPEASEKYANALMAYLEQARDNFQMQSAIKGAINSAGIVDNEKIDELTAAIKELTKQLQEQKK